MSFGRWAYSWSDLITKAPDGVYVQTSTIACGRSIIERWIAKENGQITRAGYRHYASCSPPPGPSRPPAMVDDHSVRLWLINGDVGGDWYAWYPPRED